MTTTYPTLQYDGLQQFGAVYLRMDQNWQNADFSDQLEAEVVPFLAHVHEDYFNQESGPDGPWAPLHPRTVKRKGFDTILIENNNMRSSLLFPGGDHIEDVGDSFLTWGTADEKAYFHQMGTTRMPARPFVGLLETHVDTITNMIADEAVRLLMQ